MVPYESPELVRLFTAYTAGPGSIGRRLAGAVADRGRDDPLIAATATDIALFPGGGRPPEVEGFRISTRGFKELSAVSHLGPAVASLVGLRTLLGDGSWQADAERLLIEVKAARAANSARLWRDTIAVEAYRGREQEIADMIDYSCAVTTRYLTAALADESYLTPETLRADYLAGGGDAELPVPLNHMMVATFFLVSMDIGFRLTRWFTERDIDWERAMVLIAGRQGRPTAGVTWDTSSVATMIMAISGGRLPWSGCTSPRTRPPSPPRPAATSARWPRWRSRCASCGAASGPRPSWPRSCSTATPGTPSPPRPARTSPTPPSRRSPGCRASVPSATCGPWSPACGWCWRTRASSCPVA
ncbi:DUF5624 domain-containing protein [Thermocatellispora tengchongensis]|uniref:DUF5624 domain-containing protein n=1 Tax=Thermocatellispora tengchongensis TaxID=1073253 RepID=UPI0036448A4C